MWLHQVKLKEKENERTYFRYLMDIPTSIKITIKIVVDILISSKIKNPYYFRVIFLEASRNVTDPENSKKMSLALQMSCIVWHYVCTLYLLTKRDRSPAVQKELHFCELVQLDVNVPRTIWL